MSLTATIPTMAFRCLSLKMCKTKCSTLQFQKGFTTYSVIYKHFGEPEVKSAVFLDIKSLGILRCIVGYIITAIFGDLTN
jgi:hypothetical protein